MSIARFPRLRAIANILKPGTGWKDVYRAQLSVEAPKKPTLADFVLTIELRWPEGDEPLVHVWNGTCTRQDGWTFRDNDVKLRLWTPETLPAWVPADIGTREDTQVWTDKERLKDLRLFMYLSKTVNGRLRTIKIAERLKVSYVEPPATMNWDEDDKINDTKSIPHRLTQAVGMYTTDIPAYVAFPEMSAAQTAELLVGCGRPHRSNRGAPRPPVREHPSHPPPDGPVCGCSRGTRGVARACARAQATSPPTSTCRRASAAGPSACRTAATCARASCCATVLALARRSNRERYHALACEARGGRRGG